MNVFLTHSTGSGRGATKRRRRLRVASTDTGTECHRHMVADLVEAFAFHSALSQLAACKWGNRRHQSIPNCFNRLWSSLIAWVTRAASRMAPIQKALGRSPLGRCQSATKRRARAARVTSGAASRLARKHDRRTFKVPLSEARYLKKHTRHSVWGEPSATTGTLSPMRGTRSKWRIFHRRRFYFTFHHGRCTARQPEGIANDDVSYHRDVLRFYACAVDSTLDRLPLTLINRTGGNDKKLRAPLKSGASQRDGEDHVQRRRASLFSYLSRVQHQWVSSFLFLL